MELNEECPETKMNDLSFLLRPPVTKEEVNAAAPRIHDAINAAHNAFESGGVENLLQYISTQNEKNKNNKDGTNLDEEEEAQILTSDEEGNDGKITGDARPYQVAMVERAKRQNTIVQLNTGLGKTLIAIMTIRHFSQEYRGLNLNGHSKQTWFLVPSVALAVQQTQTLRVNLPYKVATACHTGRIVDYEL